MTHIGQPFHDPGDGRTKCETCQKYVWPAIHSCRGLNSPLVTQRSITDRFQRFHEDNPSVYTELVDMARQLQARGYTKLGIELIWSAFRWNRMMRTTADEYGFKLNDHYRSRYARLIMANEPDLADFFQTRTLRTP